MRAIRYVCSKNAPHMRTILIAGALLASVNALTQTPQKIAVSRTFGNPGQVGLFMASSDGSNETPLLPSGNSDYDPAWAPDGSFIVFTSDRAGSAELFLVKPDGTGLVQLTKDPAYDDQAAISPDSRQLVFVSTRGGGTSTLWIMNIATHEFRRLTSGNGGDYRPSWSPDGKWIAFSSSRRHSAPFAHGRWERVQLADLYIIHPDQSGMKKVSDRDGFCGSPKWMPDSRHLLSYCMSAEDTVATRPQNPDPGHDTKLVSVDIETGASVDLPAGPGVKINPSPLPGNDVAGH